MFLTSPYIDQAIALIDPMMSAMGMLRQLPFLRERGWSDASYGAASYPQINRLHTNRCRIRLLSLLQVSNETRFKRASPQEAARPSKPETSDLLRIVPPENSQPRVQALNG